MVRGCNLIAGDDISTSPDSAFYVRLQDINTIAKQELTPQAFREDGHLKTMRARISTSNPPHISPTELDLATHSLRALTSLPMSPTEHTYFSILTATIAHAYTSPEETYTTFVRLYNTPSSWTHDEFQAFVDPNNGTAQILLAHFIAVQAILTPVLWLERVGFQGVDAPTCVLGWIEGVYRNLPGRLRGHVAWPRQVSRYPFMRFLGQGLGDEEEASGLFG
jgi:hypothetical protein